MVIAFDGMPARLEPAGVVVGREIGGHGAESPARRGGGPRGRLEHGGLACARRAHEVQREDARLEEVLAVVACGAVVAGQDLLVQLHRDELRVAAAAGRAHQGTSISMPSRVSASEPSSSRAGASHAGQRRIAPRRDRRLAARAGPARGDAGEGERGARADRPRAERLVSGLEELGVDARELAHPDGEPVHGERVALLRLRLHAGDERLDEGVLVHRFA